MGRYQERERSMSHLLRIGIVDFPAFAGININMMPFVIGEKASLPQSYEQYWPLIQACHIEKDEEGRIGYLSIMESVVQCGTSQRRPGIHTDGHGSSAWGWGRGAVSDNGRVRGLYMASNTAQSCRAWNYPVEAPGDAGDCESLRDILEQSTATYMDANTIYWMTDKCPHESLPVMSTAQRQWFRVVTHAVDVWYAYHSTPNSLGVLPNGKIIYGDKFASSYQRLPAEAGSL